MGRGDIFHQLLDFVTQSYYPQVCIILAGYFICTCIIQTTVKRRLAYYIQYSHKTWCTCRVLEDGVKESRRVYILKCLYNYRAHVSFHFQILSCEFHCYYSYIHDRAARAAVFFREVCVKTAHLVSAWQCVGFCHG